MKPEDPSWGDILSVPAAGPGEPTWDVPVKPDDPSWDDILGVPAAGPGEPTWDMSVKPEDPSWDDILGAPAAGPGGPLDMDIPPPGTHSSELINVIGPSRRSVFATWEVQLNVALEYDHEKVLSFTLCMCLSDAQKYDNNLVSAWDGFMACRLELVFIMDSDKDSWDDLFVFPQKFDSKVNNGNRKGNKTLTIETTLIDGINVSIFENVTSAVVKSSIIPIEENMSVAISEEHAVVCSIFAGSFQQMPSIRVCFMRKSH